MHVMYDRCCGLDVHKKRVSACLTITQFGGQPVKLLVPSFVPPDSGLHTLLG